MRIDQLLWAVLLAACAGPVGAVTYDEADFASKPLPSFRVATGANGAPVDTVIGKIRTYRIQKGDTLIDLARYYDLGYNEIVEANPGIDAWVPPAGAIILLPTQYVLPCCTYQGLVVNIPEMRLYYYQREKGDPSLTLYTFPVGLGRDDWPTPRARFKVRGKTVNPQWNIPESIRQEHIKDRDDPRTFIPGGAPDNPLGKYRIELTLPLYGIHGTDIPWGVGMQVSHGCVRLYPEDIERLFPRVPVGTAGEFTYQTIKIGRRGGQAYLETHQDIYGQTPALFQEAMAAIGQQGLAGQVDTELVLSAIKDSEGMPIEISPERAPSLAAAQGQGDEGTPHQDHAQAGDD